MGQGGRVRHGWMPRVRTLCRRRRRGEDPHSRMGRVFAEGAPVTLKERWYETLEIASSFARRRKVPMYAFALATSHGRYPVPTKAHLRLQMYSNLAHGAQLLQYFRYRAVAPWAKRSALFELIREMNQEIQARAGERARAQGRHLRPCRRLRRPVLAGARRRRRLRRARGGGAWSR